MPPNQTYQKAESLLPLESRHAKALSTFFY
jgi:hypothetical protein